MKKLLLVAFATFPLHAYAQGEGQVMNPNPIVEEASPSPTARGRRSPRVRLSIEVRGSISFEFGTPDRGGVIGMPSCTPADLRSIMHRLSRNVGTLRVISGHRPGARIAGTRKPSYHASCRALDFHPPAGTYSRAVSFLRSNWDGGIGTYSGRLHHIHIDNGPSVKFHHSTGRVAWGKRRRR